MARITARYPGTCTYCGGAIRRGAEIEYSRTTGAYHPACVTQSQQATPDEARIEAIAILSRLTAAMKRGPQTARHTDGLVLLRTDRFRWLTDGQILYYQDADGTWEATWTRDLELTLLEIAKRLQERPSMSRVDHNVALS
jgi:hypothetical protein